MNKTLKTELTRLQKEYIEAKKSYELIKKVEKECKIKILAENEFYTSDFEECNEEIERILSPLSDFRMSDEDSIKYFKLCFEEYLKRGLKVRDYETTPDYEAFPRLRKAGEDLLKVGIDIIMEKEKYLNKTNREQFEEVTKHWKHREEMIELTLKLKL